MIHSLLSGLPDLYEEISVEMVEMEEDGTVQEDVPDTAEINTPANDSCDEEKTAVDTPPASSGEEDADPPAKSIDLDSSEARSNGNAKLEDAEDHTATATLRRRNVLEKPAHVLEASDDTVQTYATALENQEAAQPSEQQEEKVPATRSRSMSSPARAHRPRLSLTSLLRRSDELFALYPPSHPAILLSGIMGPQSVVFTWSQVPSELPVDDEAELMVTQPQLIVLPMQPEEIEQEEEREERKSRRGRPMPKPPRIGRVVVQRKAVVASAVLVLGVAMAIYGLQTAPERARGGARFELRRLSRLFGGFVVGAGERLWEGLVAMTV